MNKTAKFTIYFVYAVILVGGDIAGLFMTALAAETCMPRPMSVEHSWLYFVLLGPAILVWLCLPILAAQAFIAAAIGEDAILKKP